MKRTSLRAAPISIHLERHRKCLERHYRRQSHPAPLDRDRDGRPAMPRFGSLCVHTDAIPLVRRDDDD